MRRSPLAFARPLALSAAVALAASSTRAADAPLYNLGTFGTTGAGSSGQGVNSAGVVTGSGWTTSSIFGPEHAFRYAGPPGGGSPALADLGTLGGASSHGWAVNDAGQIAGSSDTAAGPAHAFLYTGVPGSGGKMVDLGTLGGTFSSAQAINATGQIAGNSATAAGGIRGYRYTGTPGSGGAMADLGTLGGTFSVAYGINAGGQVVGHSYLTGDATYQGYVYTGTPGAGGAMLALGTLGGSTSDASAINDAGHITGTAALADNTQHAYLYTGTPGAGGHMADLGALGTSVSYGYGINNAGWVVGTSVPNGLPPGSDVFHAFLYTGTPGVDGRMIDLDAWLDSAYPAEGAKWLLRGAQAVSGTGLIVGYADYNDGPGGLPDGRRGFLLDASRIVPEPSSGLVAMVAGAGLLARRKRKVHGARRS